MKCHLWLISNCKFFFFSFLINRKKILGSEQANILYDSRLSCYSSNQVQMALRETMVDNAIRLSVRSENPQNKILADDNILGMAFILSTSTNMQTCPLWPDLPIIIHVILPHYFFFLSFKYLILICQMMIQTNFTNYAYHTHTLIAYIYKTCVPLTILTLQQKPIKHTCRVPTELFLEILY